MMDLDAQSISLDELRRRFDESFAEPRRERDIDGWDLLILRTDERRYAVPVAEVAGLRRCPSITKLPSHRSDLRGLAGIRGKLAAVYHFTALTGGGNPETEQSWLLLCSSEPPLGLTFHAVEGYVRAPPAQISIPESSDEAKGHRIGVYTGGDTPCDVLSVRSWVDTLVEDQQ